MGSSWPLTSQTPAAFRAFGVPSFIEKLGALGVGGFLKGIYVGFYKGSVLS